MNKIHLFRNRGPMRLCVVSETSVTNPLHRSMLGFCPWSSAIHTAPGQFHVSMASDRHRADSHVRLHRWPDRWRCTRNIPAPCRTSCSSTLECGRADGRSWQYRKYECEVTARRSMPAQPALAAAPRTCFRLGAPFECRPRGYRMAAAANGVLRRACRRAPLCEPCRPPATPAAGAILSRGRG